VTTGDQWRDLLDRARERGETLGADLDEFPRDFAQYARYARAFRDLAPRYPMPGPLSIAEFDEFLADAGPYDRVSVEDILPDGERRQLAA
jgi:hypothetical protein